MTINKTSQKSKIAKSAINRWLHLGTKTNVGFTMIELLAIIAIVGILAGIVAPSWLSFISKRRVNATNDVIWSAIRKAQSEAKRTKESYSVFVQNDNNSPKIEIYKTRQPDGNNVDPEAVDRDSEDNFLEAIDWRLIDLRAEADIRQGQVALTTNIGDPNKIAEDGGVQNTGTITFDALGALVPDPILGDRANPTGLIVAVSAVDSNGEVINGTERCVKVTTLLGSMVQGRGAECDFE